MNQVKDDERSNREHRKIYPLKAYKRWFQLYVTVTKFTCGDAPKGMCCEPTVKYNSSPSYVTKKELN